MTTETDPLSKTLCFLVFRIQDNGQSKEKKKVILKVIRHHQNPLKSTIRNMFPWMLKLKTSLYYSDKLQHSKT
jgi:hypothetical protein